VKYLVAVRDFMSRSPLTVDSATSVAEACRLMGEKHVGSILVSSKGVANAIFTERDLLSKVLPDKKDLSKVTVGAYASSPLATVAGGTDVKEAARIMTEMKVRRLVVVRDGQPAGIFTAADLARAAGKSPLEI
jgi:signal-transduction protein with cAMP-binding, CBS, and nucleotidyltransferase domain